MSIPYFFTSVYPTQTEPRHSMAAFHSSHAFSHACAPAMQYACSSSSPRIYPDGSQKRGEKKGIRGACFWFISLHFSSPIICLYRSELHTNQDSCTIPRAVAMMQIVESFPCTWHTYLAIYKAREEDRDSVVGDTEGASAINTIDC